MNSMNLITEISNKCCLIVIHMIEIWINKTTPSTANEYILSYISNENNETSIFEYVLLFIMISIFLCLTIKDDAFYYFCVAAMM